MNYHFRLSKDEFKKYLQDYFNDRKAAQEEDPFYKDYWRLYLNGTRYVAADSFFITADADKYKIEIELYGQGFIYKPNTTECGSLTLPEYIINKEEEKMNIPTVDEAIYNAFSDALSSSSLSWTSDDISIPSTSSINISGIDSTHSKWSDSLTIKADTVGTVGTICDSYATIADKAYVDSKIKALETDINEIKINGDPLGETIKFKNNEYVKVVRKEENNMFNFDFGPCKDSNIKMSTYGLAVKDTAGKWVSYDKTNDSIVDVSPLTFGDGKYFYKMPVAIKDIKVGDVIIHEKRPMFVGMICKDGDLSVVDIMSAERKVIMPVKNMFNFNYYIKVVSIMDMCGVNIEPNEENPFGNPMMFMLLTGDEKTFNKDMIIPMMMASGMNKENSINNPLMLMMMMDKIG